MKGHTILLGGIGGAIAKIAMADAVRTAIADAIAANRAAAKIAATAVDRLGVGAAEDLGATVEAAPAAGIPGAAVAVETPGVVAGPEWVDRGAVAAWVDHRWVDHQWEDLGVAAVSRGDLAEANASGAEIVNGVVIAVVGVNVARSAAKRPKPMTKGNRRKNRPRKNRARTSQRRTMPAKRTSKSPDLRREC